MASQQQVKQYLAHWFQIGRKVVINNGQKTLLPKIIFQNGHYSPEFESCWQQITNPKNSHCYLEDTEQTIEELLSPTWEVIPCSRCVMPIAVRDRGFSSVICPCHTLNGWPNTELPQPRQPVDSRSHLHNLQQRLGENRKFSARD